MAQQPPKPPKGVLIQDITDGEPEETSDALDAAASAPPPGKKKGKAAVKKGFLQSTERAALYEGGSSEGGKEVGAGLPSHRGYTFCGFLGDLTACVTACREAIRASCPSARLWTCPACRRRSSSSG